MPAEQLKTLFHPFEAGVVPVMRKGRRVLFLGAEPGFRVPEGFDAELQCVQGFRPHFRALQMSGFTVTPRIEGNDFNACLVLAGRHRGQNEQLIAEAIEHVVPGGLILVAGSKDDGIASLRKRMGALVALEGHLPKYHGMAFWFRRIDADAAATQLRAANPPLHIEGRFNTAPGMFSFARIDAGSRLLAENLPSEMHGHVADFCAGWGYLAAEMAARAPAISALDLYEADFEALEAARVNVGSKCEARFMWADLMSEAVGVRYDMIVMNPPFHRSRAAEPEIGTSLIRVAAKSLKPGGRLFMVANRQLPYETTLAAAFSSHSELARDGTYKVLTARR